MAVRTGQNGWGCSYSHKGSRYTFSAFAGRKNPYFFNRNNAIYGYGDTSAKSVAQTGKKRIFTYRKTRSRYRGRILCRNMGRYVGFRCKESNSKNKWVWNSVWWRLDGCRLVRYGRETVTGWVWGWLGLPYRRLANKSALAPQRSAWYFWGNFGSGKKIFIMDWTRTYHQYNTDSERTPWVFSCSRRAKKSKSVIESRWWVCVELLLWYAGGINRKIESSLLQTGL